jgi:hypothetical protein
MMVRIVIGSSLLVLLTHGVAWACSCSGETNPVEEDLASHDIVVFGEVRSVGRPLVGCDRPFGNPYNVRIEVMEAFAGAEDGETITVHTHTSGASCGIPFEEGEQWLVFAYGPDSWASLCGPSQLAASDDPRLEALRELR